MHNIRRGMRWAALAWLGVLACNGAVEPPGTSSELEAQTAVSTLSGGGVELRTNAIQGTARLTNQNTDILALLATDPWRYGYAYATSTNPSGFSASTSSITLTDPTEFTFEMLVEAGAAGDSGVVYDVSARRGNYYLPKLSGVIVKPPNVQPDPTPVLVEACVGVIDIKFGTDETCETLATVSTAYASFNTYYKSASRYIGYVTGGWNQSSTITHGVNTGSGTVYRTNTLPLSVGCDEIVPVCIAVPPLPPPPAKGALTGPWEIIGEPGIGSRYVWASGGPDNSSGSHYSPTPTAPAGDPSTWWSMSNLPEGDYGMDGLGYVRSGREYTQIYTPYLESWSPAGRATVVAGQTTPVTKVIDGQTRHAFSMLPAYYYGTVRLVDPYVSSHPGAHSSLQSLFFSGDHDSNGDGIPNFGITTGSYFYTSSNAGGSIYSAFSQRFNPATGELASSYDQVLPSPFDIPLSWYQNYLRLRYWSQGPDFSTRPGMYDPVKFRSGELYLYPSSSSRLIVPGQSARLDSDYCFNEMQIDYTTTLGTFYNPWADVSGSFNGQDWEGRQKSYSVSGNFYGTPYVSGYANPTSYAQPSGSIYLSLPQGNYTLRPGANMVLPSGQVNTASFAPIQVTLGCGQRLKVVPPLTVAISPLAGCADSGTVPVSGVVTSSPAEVDHIWYRVNGGPEVTLCTNCGMDPSFAFDVTLQDCENTLQVFAFTDGMPEPATGYQEITWDDPADGPSCPGTYCVNRPPVARCRNVTVGASETCGEASASVDDGSYDPDTGDTFSCVQSPEGPYVLGSRRVTLTCTDASGLSASCEATVTVKDVTPPVLTCPASEQLECNDSTSASFTASAEDGCGGAPTVMCTPASGDGLPPGLASATCTATDAAGNQASCSFPVTVVDTQAPAIVCPAAVSAECTGNHSATVGLPEAMATDSCQPPAVTGGGLGSYPLGVSQASFTAVDPSGNTATCTTQVTVVDTQPPTLELVGEASLTLGCGDSPTTGVVATDVCAGDLSEQVQPVGLNVGVPGTYQVSYQVTDAAGNTTQGLSRTVTVLESPGPATLTLLGDSQMTLECGVDTWVDPGATAANGCGQPLEVHRYNSGSDPYGPGPDTSVEGTYFVQYLAWDATGYMEGALRTVHVDDRMAPTLTLQGPAHMTHTCGTGFVDPGVTATDACYGDLSSSVVATGYVNGWVPGTYTVRYEVRDSGGNMAPLVTRTVEVVNCPW